MFNQNELEELYDEFLSVDNDVCLTSEEDFKKLDNALYTNDFFVNTIKNSSNLKNNNFLNEINTTNLDEPDFSIQLDLLNQNFVGFNDTRPHKNAKVPSNGAEFGSWVTGTEKLTRPASLFAKKEDEIDVEVKEVDEKCSSQDNLQAKGNIFHPNEWGPESLGLWHSGPSTLCSGSPANLEKMRQESSCAMSFTTSEDPGVQPFGVFSTSSRAYSHQQLGVKVEMVYKLLSMLDTNNHEDMSKTFLAMSSSPESCHAMRQSGCLPLLIQLIHSPELDVKVRNRAAEALSNIVEAQTDEKRRRREVRVLKLLQQVREYCNELRLDPAKNESITEGDAEKHPVTAVGALMKFSFDAEHRQAICTLGGLHAIAELIQIDHEVHGDTNEHVLCVTLRRYAGMSLTNLTFGDGKNKALLCSFNKFMRALVCQLKSSSEDLRQVTASVLRNLSWRADSESKQSLKDVEAVKALMMAAMEVKKESTLKSILSALWNLSAHCSTNKVDICSVPGALAFLVKMLGYKSPSNTLAIVENAGGIIRNISSHIAVREDYRQILRDNNCFEVLLEHLKSPSLTIVSNACGTLWNLSARCAEDQRKLWEMGATTMLRSLIQSKHKMISMGSSAALKNLLVANPNGNLTAHIDSTAKSLGVQNLPTLFVRKQRALEQELNITLAETCDNIEPSGSPTLPKNPQNIVHETLCSGPKRSESHESIRSSKSDSVYERLNQIAASNENKQIVNNSSTTLHESLNEKQTCRKIDDQKLLKRYKVSMIPTLKKMNQDKINEKTKEESQGESESNVTIDITELKTNSVANNVIKEQPKRGIPVLKSKPRPKSFSDKKENDFVPSEFDSIENDSPQFFGESAETLNAVGVNKTRSSPSNGNTYCPVSENEVQPENKNGNIGQYGNKDNEYIQQSLQESVDVINLKREASSLISSPNSSQQNAMNENKNNFNRHNSPVENISAPVKSEDKGVYNVVNTDSSSLGKVNHTIVPDFKIGCEITDSKILRHEASKICREIQKTQEMDLGCSLNSEISVASCSSFLDAADYSLFEVSHDPIDFEEGLSQDACRTMSKVRNFPFRKPLTSLTVEPVSLPSLSSLKNDPLEGFDLESSIISVASITSEVAETYSKEKETGLTFTKMPENDATMSSADETIEDSTFPCNEVDTANEDLTLEYYDDEISLDSRENLPYDGEPSVLNAAQSTRKLTPKEKRKTFQDRYRTYTIRDLKNKVVAEEANSSGPNVKSVTEQKPQTQNFVLEDPMIFHQEIDYDRNSVKKVKNIRSLSNGNTEDAYQAVLSQFNEKTKILKDSKSFDKVFDKTGTTTNDSKSLNDLLSIGPIERSELVANAKLVAFSLKTAIDEYESEVLSDSEPEDSQKTWQIDTNTYNKDSKQSDFIHGKISDPDFDNNYEDDEDERMFEAHEKKGPTITKPDEQSLEAIEQATPKAVRGRRKPLYSSPLKKYSTGPNSSMPASPKISQNSVEPQKYNLTSTKSLPNVSKSNYKYSDAPVLQREGTFTKEHVSSTETTSRIGRPVSATSRNFSSGVPLSKSKTVLVRKNVQKSTDTYKVTRPQSTYEAKTSDKRLEASAPLKKQTSLEAKNKIVGNNVRTTKKSPASNSELKNSPSNQSLKSNSSVKGVAGVKSRIPGKLQNDVGSVAVPDSGKQKTPKKEVTSKIAGLWKKVEEAKERNKNYKDDRVWIGAEKTAKKSDETLIIEQEEILDIPSRKIVHSVTCQEIVDGRQPMETDYVFEEKIKSPRLYEDCSAEKGRKVEKRRVLSAVVPPYNYNPPTVSELTPHPLKKDKSYGLASNKFTLE